MPHHGHSRDIPLWKIGIGIVILIVLLLAVQIALTVITNVMYERFLILCIVGFGFIILYFLSRFR